MITFRWATEDPNQTAKDNEQAHLVKLGEAGIARGLDPEFVQAIREMDELEGVVEKRAIDLPQEEEESSNKRARIEPPLPLEPPTIATGLLSANALDSLKFMASLNKGTTMAPKASVVKASTGLGALADYGSDSE